MQPTNSPSNIKPTRMFADLVSRIHEEWLEAKRCKVDIKSQENEDFDTTFASEIRALMYASGDVRDPSWISVLTLKSHLRTYLKSILIKANNAAQFRRDKFLEHQSVLFLFRKQKEKLQRLVSYMKITDYKFSLTKKYVEYNEEMFEEGPRVYECLKYLREILSPEEVDRIRDEKLLDPIRLRKHQRNDARTLHMSKEEYMEFSEQQQCSFLKNGLKFFSNWLLKDYTTSLKPSTLTLEIINFLTRDYVTEVIDEVLRKRESPQGALCLPSPQPKRLLDSKEQTLISKKSPSRISAIVNSYAIKSPQSLNHSRVEDIPISPDEIDSAVRELNSSRSIMIEDDSTS